MSSEPGSPASSSSSLSSLGTIEEKLNQLEVQSTPAFSSHDSTMLDTANSPTLPAIIGSSVDTPDTAEEATSKPEVVNDMKYEVSTPDNKSPLLLGASSEVQAESDDILPLQPVMPFSSVAAHSIIFLNADGQGTQSTSALSIASSSASSTVLTTASQNDDIAQIQDENQPLIPHSSQKRRANNEDHAHPAKKRAIGEEKTEIRSESVTSQSPPPELASTKPKQSKKQEVIDLDPEAVPRIVKKRLDGFPRFPDGEVFIEIAYLDEQFTYSLHRQVLERSSVWFRNTLDKNIMECDHQLAGRIMNRTKYRRRYDFKYVRQQKQWRLFRAPFTELKNKNQAVVLGSKKLSTKINVDASIPDVASAEPIEKEWDSEVKLEPSASPALSETGNSISIPNAAELLLNTPPPPLPSMHRSGVPLRACETFDNLFRTFYNMPPNIDTKNILKALEQAEDLIDYAVVFGSLAVVRPYINSSVLQYGGEIYQAIRKDPPRWLMLSVYLQSAPIFKEAIIHIVGKWGYWDWTSCAFNDLPITTRDLIMDKVSRLTTERLQVCERLSENTLELPRHNEEISFDFGDRISFDKWLVVQLWKDWFTRSHALKSGPLHRDYVDALLYRLIASASDSYLPFEAVWKALSSFKSKDFPKWKVGDVEKSLTTMKAQAQRIVSQMVVNHSMCSVEDEGIDYFTCIKVENDELPWVKEKALGMVPRIE